MTIDPTVYSKIRYWMDRAGSMEVSGFGKVLKMANRLHVCDAFLLRQENTGGSTDIESTSITKMHYLKRDEPGDFNFWWHSHHHMSAYFSQTDHDNIKLFGQHGWLLSSVFNHRGEQNTSLYLSQPTEIYLESLDFQIARPLLSPEQVVQLNHDYTANVKERKYTPTAGYMGGHGTQLDTDDYYMRDYEGLPSWNKVPSETGKDAWDAWFEQLEEEAAQREALLGEEAEAADEPEQRLLMSAGSGEPRMMSKKQLKRFRAAQDRIKRRNKTRPAISMVGRTLVWNEKANAYVPL